MLTCSFLYCTKLTSYTMVHLQAIGQHKNKAGLTYSPVYYSFASTHMVNTQLLHVQNVHTKYRKYIRRFLNLRLLNFVPNSGKLMHREYFHIFSIRKLETQGEHNLMWSAYVCVDGGGGVDNFP